jgi:CHASE2 domain-containing sensor protein
MRKFWIDSVIATFFVFLVLFSIVKVSRFSLFNVFDPLGKAIADMELTDITFSNLRVETPPVDENVTIINIGNLTRAEIAQQLRMISQFKPKAIGIDVFFDCPYCLDGKIDSICCPLAYDTLSNMMLNNAIEEAGNVVLVTKLLQSNKLVAQYGDIDLYDSLRRTDEFIRGNAQEGFASLETGAEHQEDLKVCRRFNPKMDMEYGGTEYAFSVKLAMLYDSVKAKRFLEREKHSEVINYRGNVPDPYKASAPEFANRYTYLDWYQPFDTTSFLPSIIKDRIVLMGFMGADMSDTSWDDKFITPLNKQYAGKTRPDMYGVVVHANIISMILEEDYIDELESWQEYAIAAIVCFLNVVLFTFIMKKIPVWFDGLSILLQLIQFLVCTFLMIYAMYWFSFKLNLTSTLAAIALVGTCFELYHGVIKNSLGALKNSRWFTKKGKGVLMP